MQKWFDVTDDTIDDMEVDLKLKQGGTDALNIYTAGITAGDGSGDTVLGIATFPWYVP